MDPHSSPDFVLAATTLRGGGIIAYPTETIPGLGVDPWNREALERLCVLKGRSASKGFVLLLPGGAALESVALPPCPLARTLMERFWPGALTLVLAARPGLPELLTGGGGEVAVRWSPHPTVAGILECWRQAVVSTSANQAGEPPLEELSAIAARWGDQVTPIPGPAGQGGLPSTVARVSEMRITILRPGRIGAEELRAAVPGIILDDRAGTPPR